MKFVNDCVRLMLRRLASLPLERRMSGRKNAERSFSGIWPFSHSQLAIKIRWEKYRCCVGIKQDLLRIKTMNVIDRPARDRISVITSFANFAERNATMPDSS